jgi:dimethylglycine dehydrogenase
MVGLTVAGPRSRDVLQKLTRTSLATADFGFMAFRKVDLGMAPVWLSLYLHRRPRLRDLDATREYQRYLFDLLWEAGQEVRHGPLRVQALITMRLEKNFGTWFREYRPIYTPLEAGMDRVPEVRPRLRRSGSRSRDRRWWTKTSKLTMFVVEPDPDSPADVIGDEPVWHSGPDGDRVVGWITSGATPTSRESRWPGVTSPPNSPLRPPPASRSRSSAIADRPAFSSTPSSIPPGPDARVAAS